MPIAARSLELKYDIQECSGLRSNQVSMTSILGRLWVCIKRNVSWTSQWASCQIRQIAGAHAPGMPGTFFPTTAGKQSRHASRHVRDARAVMHAGTANSRFPLNSAAGENVPGIPGACTTRDFTYLVRGPWSKQIYAPILPVGKHGVGIQSRWRQVLWLPCRNRANTRGLFY